jgi:hypothetical protein
MKIPALALIIILYFSGMVSAVPDSVITGPYAISFDLGLLHSSYEAVVTPPVNTELLDGTKVTEYVITINNNTAPFGAKITLSHIEMRNQ